MNVKLEIDNEQRFIEALKRAKSATDDLTIPLTLITKDYFKSNKAIFQLKSAGAYEDLSERYKKEKKAAVGFIYPILKRSGALEASLTNPSDGNAVAQIINKDTLLLGTSLPYAKKHQFGEGVPVRPVVFIGPEAPKYATSEQMGRPERWLNILNSYVLKKVGENIGQ